MWTFAGNVVSGASQWAILSLIAKLGSTEILGQYALAIAVANPVAMLAHMNLRAVLATDVAQRHPFGDYLSVRAVASLGGMAALAALAALPYYGQPVPQAILLIGLSLTAEAFSDLYYGLMQRRERMDLIGRSMILRGCVSVAAAGIALRMAGGVLAAAGAVAVARTATLLLYDVPRGGARLTRSSGQRDLWRSAAPLGVVLMLSALTTSLPRYAVESHLGTRDVGIFAAVASLVTIGSTAVNALGQAATTRLANYHAAGNARAFRELAVKLAALAAGLGAVGAAGAWLAGDVVLRIAYRHEYGDYRPLLVAALLAGVLVYVAAMLGYVVTSTRRFAAQMPLLGAVAVVCAITSFAAVPAAGLYGAVLGLAVAAGVQIAGQLAILARAR